MYTSSFASGSRALHDPHTPVAAVISTANSSGRSPPIALPSSLASWLSTSAPGGAEALCLDALRVVAELHESVRDGIDEARGAADEYPRPRRGRPRDLREDPRVDAPREPHPPGRPRARQRVENLESVPLLGESRELLAVDDVLERRRRVQQARRHLGAGCRSVPDHGHERHNARAARDEEKRLGRVRRLPDEVAADRSADLEAVARTYLVHEVRRDLPLVEPLDRDREPLAGC